MLVQNFKIFYFIYDDTWLKSFLRSSSILQAEGIKDAGGVFFFIKQIGEFKRLSMIYRGSTHGWTAEDFHRHCDGKGPTLVLVRSTKKVSCGGFTSVEWSSMQ